MVWGIDEKAGNVVSFELLYGRLIDKSDMKSCRRVCILDETLSLNLFGQENAVGKTIELMQGSGTEIQDGVSAFKKFPRYAHRQKGFSCAHCAV